jgi:hypothetical protein
MTRVLDYIELETRPWVDEDSPPADDIVWRFTKPTEATPKDIDALPSITGINFTPATISLGENLGTRATLTVTFRDHPHIMASESFDSGTFFGKFRARYGQRLRGEPLRWIRGTEGQTLDEMETWFFIVEAVNGPTPDGVYTITAQDILKLADGDRALAPRPTRGSTIGNIDADDTSVSVGPTGIGDIDYPASGYINIGGKEICEFTRTGDTFTITRNTTVPGTTFETEVVAHNAGARVQLCLPYIGEDPADIVSDLFTTYAEIDAGFIDTAAWQTETATYLATLYTTMITEPQGVNKLVSELVQQAGLAIWWDAVVQTMRLQVLRAVPTTAAEFNEDKFLKGSLKTQEQPNKRISEVLVYFGLREPLKPVDEDDNYRSALLTPDTDAAEEYNGVVTKTIKSRWIPFGAEQVAERLSNILLGRYRDPPRKVNFDTWRFSEWLPELGQGYQLGWTENQSMTGAQVLAPIQVTRLQPMPEKYSVEAEEVLFTFYEGDDLNDRVIIVPSNINNVNLRDMHDSIYPEVTDDDVSASPPVTLTVIINDGVIVGSTSTDNPAFDVGSWPVGFVPTVQVLGRIQGKGANGPDDNDVVNDGGVALFTRNDIVLDSAGGEIWGGGGAGGYAAGFSSGFRIAAGGGGAGQLPGSGAVPIPAGETSSGTSSPGTTEAGGAGGNAGGGIVGGTGGGPGLAGTAGTGLLGDPGGQPGAAIDGDSFVTYSSPDGDIRGPQIN